MTEFLSTTRGDAVAYDLRGTGPAVIFVAGARPHRATDPITTPTAVAAAERGLTTVVYDRLGRGESPAAGRIDLDRELAAISALIERAGGGAVLCGHSSGCWISLAAAAAGLPVSGLVLWEAPGSESGGSNARWIAEVERRMDAGDLEGALRHYMKDMPPEWFEGARHSPDFADTLALVPSFRADGEAMVWQQSAPCPSCYAVCGCRSRPSSVSRPSPRCPTWRGRWPTRCPVGSTACCPVQITRGSRSPWRPS